MAIDSTSIMLSWWDVIGRFLCALLVGMLIGGEREFSNRPAGMRTHILVSVGACAVMMTSQVIFAQYHAFGANPDPARLPAQVVTGVGFLGAGTILHQGANVKGLTTAASLWAVACLGIATGAGYYSIAIVGMVFVFITLTLMEAIQHFLVGPSASLRECQAETQNSAACLEALHNHARTCHVLLSDVTIEHREEASNITFHIVAEGFRANQRRERFLKALAEDPLVGTLRIFSPENPKAAPENAAT